MNRHERGLEFKVGIFVFVGLAMLGALVVQFGRLGEGFKTYYTITVRFNDARETGIDDLTRTGGALVNDLRGTVQKIDTTVDRLNQDTLSPANMENLKASLQHLNQATSALAQSSKKLDGVVEQADSTMASAKKAADDLQNAIADTRKVVRSATQGKGLVATLLNDPALAADLHALITNLRAHGA